MDISTPIHPGKHLAEIIDELGISQYRLAVTIGVPHHAALTRLSTADAPSLQTPHCVWVRPFA